MKSKNFYLLSIFLIVTACGTTTSITSSYKDPNATFNYKKLFIAALTENNAARQVIENNLSEDLKTRGIAAVKSIDVMTPQLKNNAQKQDQQVMINKIAESKCDAVLVIALLKQNTEYNYVQDPQYFALPHYATFRAYYDWHFDNNYSAGYYETDKIYYLQTNLYDSKTEKLIWSAQSKTYNPTNIDDFMVGYKKALTAQLVKDGIIAPQN